MKGETLRGMKKICMEKKKGGGGEVPSRSTGNANIFQCGLI